MKRFHELPEQIKGFLGIGALMDIITNKSKTIEREDRPFHLLLFSPSTRQTSCFNLLKIPPYFGMIVLAIEQNQQGSRHERGD